MRLGLFGGTFDPIHYGHINIAIEAQRKFQLDRVDFIIAKSSPFAKQILFTAEQRLNLVKQFLAEKQIENFAVSRVELDRSGPSYSYQTVENYRQEFPEAELFWIMGADAWNSFYEWKSYQYIAENVTFIIFARAGSKPNNLVSDWDLHFLEDNLYQISSTEVKAALTGDQNNLSKFFPNTVNDLLIKYYADRIVE